MIDPQVNSEEQPLPNKSQERRPARRVRGWRLFGGLLLLLMVAGLFVFRSRSANNDSQTAAHDVPQLPFSATWLDMDPESGVLEVEVTGQGRRLSIQTASAVLIDPEKTNGNGRCAMLHKEMTITEGDWLEVGQELKAGQIVVSEPEPAIVPQNMTLAPPDTLAYLAEPLNDLERPFEFGAFLALSEDGTTTDLMTVPPLMSAGWHTQSKIPWPARFLLTLTVPNCKEAWLLMYDPQQGIVDRWLTLFSSRSLILVSTWRPREGESYLPAQLTEPLRLPNSSFVLGWLSEKIVTLDIERGTVKLINLTSGEVTKSIPLASKYVPKLMLSEDGKHLFYTLPSTFEPAVHALELESGQDKLLFSASDDEWVWPLSGGANRVLLAVTKDKSGRLHSTKLLLIDLKASHEPITIIEIPSTQYMSGALFCADDRVLMTIDERGYTQVRMWQPDGSISTLLKTDKRLQLLSCR